MLSKEYNSSSRRARRTYKRREELDNKWWPRDYCKTKSFRRICQKRRDKIKANKSIAARLPKQHCPTHMKKAGIILCGVSAAFTIRLMIAWGNDSFFEIGCMVLVGAVFEYCKVVLMPTGIHLFKNKIWGLSATLIITATLLVCFSIFASIGFTKHATDNASEMAQHQSFEYQQAQQAIITANDSIKAAQAACKANAATNANIANAHIKEKMELIANHFYSQSKKMKFKTESDGCDRIQSLQRDRDQLMAKLSSAGKESSITAMDSASSAIANAINSDAATISSRGQLFICAMIEALSIICLSTSGFRMDFEMLMALISSRSNYNSPNSPSGRKRRKNYSGSLKNIIGISSRNSASTGLAKASLPANKESSLVQAHSSPATVGATLENAVVKYPLITENQGVNFTEVTPSPIGILLGKKEAEILREPLREPGVNLTRNEDTTPLDSPCITQTTPDPVSYADRMRVYKKACDAKVGESVNCPWCAISFSKKTYNHRFCLKTHKDEFWNALKPERLKSKGKMAGKKKGANIRVIKIPKLKSVK